jgi:hypothetical protein
MTRTKSPSQRLSAVMKTLQRAAPGVGLLYHLEALEEPIDSAARAARELAVAVQAQDAARFPMNATDQGHRLPEIIRVLERAAPSLGMTQINAASEVPKLAADAGDVVRQLEQPLTALEEAAQFIEILTAAEQQRRSPAVEHLDLKVRIASLVTALWLMAKRHGALNLSIEMLRIKVVEHVAPDFHRFWQLQPPEQLLGLMRHEPVASQLQLHDVLLWEGQRDKQWRLVDGNRVSAGAAMWDLVHAAARGGRCRFCDLEELDSGELWLIPSLGVMAHELCAPYLQRCYGFARAYSSREQAVKAGAKLMSERAGTSSNLVA